MTTSEVLRYFRTVGLLVTGFAALASCASVRVSGNEEPPERGADYEVSTEDDPANGRMVVTLAALSNREIGPVRNSVCEAGFTLVTP